MNAKSGADPTTYLDDNDQFESEFDEFPEEAKEKSEQRNINEYSLNRIQSLPFSSNIKMVRTKTVIYGRQRCFTYV